MRKIIRYAGIAIIPTLWVGIIAKAETEAPLNEESHTFEPMTVIVTRTERSLAELPASVSVLDSEQIMHRQAQSMDDLLQVLPNVDFTSGPRPIGETLTIRSLSSERILTTIDGARQDSSIGHLGRFFIEPELLTGVLEAAGYSVYDLYVTWLPSSARVTGLRMDFGIDNLTNKAYRRYLSIIEEAGRNFKVALTYQF